MAMLTPAPAASLPRSSRPSGPRAPGDGDIRVAFVTDTFAPAANGVVRSVTSAIQALSTRGVQSHIFAPGTRQIVRGSKRRDVTFFPAIETRIYPSLHLSVVPLRPRDLRSFDLVHVHTPGPLGAAALLAARRAGVPSVYTYHTRFEDTLHYLAPFETAERAVGFAATRLHRALVRRATAVIAPTEPIAKEVADAYDVTPRVIPTGVESRFFAERPAGARGGLSILHLGRIAKEKNLEAVLRAMPLVLSRVPNATLRVAGTGPDRDRCRRIVNELGLKGAVDFLGFVPEERLPHVYADSDVFVSASRFETQGLTILEAMAAGTMPAIADVPVFRDLVPHNSATWFNPDDPATIADAILSAASRAPMSRELCRVVARGYSTDTAADMLLDLYRSLLTPDSAAAERGVAAAFRDY
ncbi:MAG: glycosyltransferase [Thermoplasmatota archaeon]